MRPGIYLTALYSAIALTLLFLVLVAPGLRHFGSHIRIETYPAGASIILDGAFRGVTPAVLRVAAGEHSLRIEKPHFAAVEQRFEAPGRLIGSALFPRRHTVIHALTLTDASARARDGLLDLARSSHIPRILVDTATDLAGTVDWESVYEFLDNAIFFVDDPEGARGFIGAWGLLAADGGTLTTSSLFEMLRYFAHRYSEYRGVPAWLTGVAGDQAARLLRESEPYQRALDTQGAMLRAVAAETAVPRAATNDAIFQVAGMAFRQVPGGRFVMGEQSAVNGLARRVRPFETWPHAVTVPASYLQDREVSKAAYARFVAARPAWAPQNTAALAEAGLVTEAYLEDWIDGAPPAGRENEPVVFVSSYAAAAFAQWVGEQLPAPLRALQARLPTEAEWEHAARGAMPEDETAASAHLGVPGRGLLPVGQSAPNGYGVRDTLGSVWEWTRDWYSPSRYLLWRSFAAEHATDVRLRIGDSRVVRGGSYVNDPRLIAVHTRGSQPAAWCTPVLGFRVIIGQPLPAVAASPAP